MRTLAPPAPSEEDLSLLNATELEERGFVRLPQTLAEALDRLEGSQAVRDWFGEMFVEVYLKHKRGEIDFLDGKTAEQACRLYEQVY